MKKIEERIIDAIEIGQSVKLSERDEIISDDDNVLYRLWGTIVAIVSYDRGLVALGVKDRRFSTILTKSRINAIARHFGFPSLAQKDFVWTWDDGEPYNGVRYFKYRN